MKSQKYTILAVLFSAFVLLGCAIDSARTDVSAKLPREIQTPDGETFSFTLKAKGVQIYECQATKDNSNHFEWILKEPAADLFDSHGQKVGKHYKGPTWKSDDGSSVMGEKIGSYDKDTNTIPWLLLRAKQKEGSGVFSKVTSIQRIHTVGGKAPAGGCDMTNDGKEIRVPYIATYYFNVAK